MQKKIPYLILACLIGTTIASQGSLVFTEDFNPAVVPDATGTGLIYFNGSADEYWVGASNLVNYSGDLTLDGQGLSGGRGRGAVVWLDPSSWVGGTAVIAFDVSGYSAIPGAQTYFQASYASGLGGANDAGFDVHQPFGTDLNTNDRGTATMGTLGARNVITGNGNYASNFVYSGNQWVALAFYTTGEVASFDNISLTAVVPEPSSTLGLLALVTSAFFRRRRRLLG